MRALDSGRRSPDTLELRRFSCAVVQELEIECLLVVAFLMKFVWVETSGWCQETRHYHFWGPSVSGQIDVPHSHISNEPLPWEL